jgi:hypothetical protein
VSGGFGTVLTESLFGHNHMGAHRRYTSSHLMLFYMALLGSTNDYKHTSSHAGGAEPDERLSSTDPHWPPR